MQGHLRVATIEDAVTLAPRLRAADRDECIALTGGDPLMALIASLQVSELALAMVGREGEVVGLCGIGRGNTEIDRTIWMMASDDLLKYKTEFLRKSRDWITEMNQKHPLLWNWADSRNELHLKWLRWNGFIFINRSPVHPGGPDFIHFVRIPSCA
jgi:hypothetical protein